MKHVILVVEDETSIRNGLIDALSAEGFKVLSAEDGEKGALFAETKKPSLILLDVMLPKMNGLDLCKKLRLKGNSVPIIMLTARGEEIDRVLGLELGADDYVAKPFSTRELISRIKAVLRRSGEKPAVTAKKEEKGRFLKFGDVVLDFKAYEAKKTGKKIKLSPLEFKVMKYFSEHENMVVARENLLDDVWGYDNYPSTRTVDNLIVKLRSLIENDPGNPEYLVSVHGVGYKFIK